MRWVLDGLVAALGLAFWSGCATGASSTSPWQGVIDVRAAPGFFLGESERLTAHPTIAYSRSMLGGVDGERDDVIHLGGQLRWSTVSRPFGVADFWLGAEGTYARRKTTFDAPGIDPETTNGWTLAAVAGAPLFERSAATVHGCVAAGVVKYGGSGPYLRAGFDVQPGFLRR